MEMHHAYLLVGARDKAEEHIDHQLSLLGFSRNNNSDWFPFLGETFGIRDARDLSDLVARKSFGERKIFWVAPERFTLEAQNALLKTLEEPTENTHIFLHVREKDLLVPTLLSRVEIVELGRSSKKVGPEQFLNLPITERLEFSKSFNDEGEELPAFLDGLMMLLREKGKQKHEALERVYKMRRYADGISVSKRAILEYLSFVV